MNNFNDLAKLALNEARLTDYIKAAGRATLHGAARVVQGAAKVADIAALDSGMKYNNQFGSIANAAGKVVQSMKELGATAQEEEIMKKLFGENPKKGDKINVELPGIQAPGAVITEVKPGVKDGSMYTVDLFPIIGNLAADTSTTLGGGGMRLQNQQKAVKDRSPIDKIIFTKGNTTYGSTNVTLSLYKADKLVAARNIPGLRDSGGLHFNGAGKPWTLNLDSSDSIDFADIAAFVAEDKSLGLTSEQQKQVLGVRDYPQLKQLLTKLGKGNMYIQAYNNAITALRQGKPVPRNPQSNAANQSTQPQNQTTGINARTPEGNPVPGQTRYTTKDKKKTYLYGKGGWLQLDPTTNKWSAPVLQQAQITAAWQKSQNITSAATPSKKATRRATQTKAGIPVVQPTAADLASMNLPPHPLTSTPPRNIRR